MIFIILQNYSNGKNRLIQTTFQNIVRKFVLFLSCLVLTLSALLERPSLLAAQSSQTIPLHFRHYGLKEGNPGSQILTVFEDKNQFIWLATNGAGLLRFDGTTFREYPNETYDSFTRYVESVKMEESGIFWTSYHSSSIISRYDPSTDRFTYYDVSKWVDVPYPISSCKVFGVDAHDRLWVMVANGTISSDPIIFTLDVETLSLLRIYNSDPNSPEFEDSKFWMNNLSYVRLDQSYSDDQGFWMLGQNALFRADRSGTIHRYPSQSNPDSFFRVYSLTTLSDTLWASTNTGLYWYDTREDRFIPSTILPEPYQTIPIYSMYQISESEIWISTFKGMLKKNSDGIFPFPVIPELESVGTPVLIPQTANDDYVWFVNVTAGLDNPVPYGLVRFHRPTQTFSLCLAQSEDPTSLKSDYFLSQAYYHTDGTLFISYYYGGISTLEPRSHQFRNRWKDVEQYTPNQGDYVDLAEESPSGSIYFTLNGRRLFRFPTPDAEMELVYDFTESKKSLSEDNSTMAIALFVESDERIWISTFNKGLLWLEYDNKQKRWIQSKQWKPFSNTDGFNIGRVIGFHRSKDTLWLGSEKGLASYSFTTQRFTSYYNDDRFSPEESTHFGPEIYQTSKGELFFYKKNLAGIKSFNPNFQKVTIYPLLNADYEKDKFSSITYFETIYEDKQGRILLGGLGVYVLDDSSQAFIHFSKGYNTFVNSIQPSNSGEYILTTVGSGVAWMNKEGQIVHQLNKESGFDFVDIFGVQTDSSNTLWIQHPIGLSRYSRENERIVTYTSDYSPSLRTSDFGINFYSFKSGYLMPIWMSEPIVLFDPEQIPIDTTTLSTTITDVYYGNQQDSLDTSTHNVLPHDFTNFTLSFTAPYYKQPREVEFRTKIQGLEQEWSSWTTARNRSITSLPPGKYTFQIQNRNSDKEIHPETATFSFTVLPPWYQTWWALTGFLLAFIGSGLWGVQSYIHYRTQRAYERMRADQADELAKIDHLKTHFLTTISHEIRTPLTLVVGPIEEMLKSKTALPQTWKTKLALASRNSRRLRQLVEQILDVTRLDAQEMNLRVAQIDLIELLSFLCKSFESSAERKNTSISFSADAASIEPLWLDSDKIEKVFTNLFSNALKFTENGSITLSLINHPSTVEIIFSDTGKGIDPHRLPHIFDRFHTTFDSKTDYLTGLGIGLTITKEFIERHSGTISVESELGKGTTFTISLPKGKSHFPDSTLFLEAVDKPTYLPYINEDDLPLETEILGKSKEELPLLLLVEDNEDMQRYVQEVLNPFFRIITAQDGTLGKQQLALHTPDVIISDLMMPNMDGFEFARWVKSRPEYRFIPFIILSAKMEVEDRITGFDIGINEYIVKPFNAQELQVRIDNLLKYKQLRESLPDEDVTEIVSIEEEFLQKLKEYTLSHLSEKITVEALAEAGHVSRAQIYRILQQYTGFSPADFVREIRLQEALKLLQNRQVKTTSEIAHHVGFSSRHHFTRIFTKRFGRKPGDFL